MHRCGQMWPYRSSGPKQLRLGAVALCLLALALACTAAPGVASAAAPGVLAWGQANTTGLPSDASISASQIAEFNAVACGSPTSCIAVGQYLATTGYQAVVAPITAGVLGPATEVTLPQGFATTGQHAQLNAITCVSATSCMAVGEYNDATGQTIMVVPITNGVPGVATSSALPAGAILNYTQTAFLGSVACPSTTSCDAVGEFLTAAGTEPLTVPITNGVAGTTDDPQLPSGYLMTNQDSYLNSVSCQSQTTCLAVGTYSNSHGSEPLDVPITNGTPGATTQPALPSDELTTDQGAVRSLRSPAGASPRSLGQARRQ
jgi:hypothetical protein